MSTTAKVLVVVNTLLAGWFLASVSNYLGHQDTFKKHLLEERAAHEVTRTTKDVKITDLTGRVSVQDTSIRGLTADKSTAESENSRIGAENETLRANYTALAEQHAILSRAMDRMSTTAQGDRDTITQLNSNGSSQRDQIVSLQDDLNSTRNILSAKELALENSLTQGRELQRQITDVEERLRQADMANAFYRERFPGVEAISQPSHAGRILSSNDGSNVYVISLGAEDGVKPGFTYMVSRGSQFIADIQIDDVQSKKSSGFAIRDRKQGAIQIGDVIRSSR